MATEPHQKDSGRRLLTAGAIVLPVLCCAGPALLGATAVGALGSGLASPWLAGLVVLLGGLGWALRRRHGGNRCHRGSCGSPSAIHPRDTADRPCQRADGHALPTPDGLGDTVPTRPAN